MRKVPPVSPGEMLDEEFLKPLGLTKYRLAKAIGVPRHRIDDIVVGKRAITADTDLRLCRYFGLSDGWWLRGQANCDTANARETMGEACRTSFVANCWRPDEAEDIREIGAVGDKFYWPIFCGKWIRHPKYSRPIYSYRKSS